MATIETIFIGGGTPTSLSVEQLDRLLTLIHMYIPLEQVVEFTSESNPDELTLEKMQLDAQIWSKPFKYGCTNI